MWGSEKLRGWDPDGLKTEGWRKCVTIIMFIMKKETKCVRKNIVSNY